MLSPELINLFSLVLMRMSGCIFMNPIFGRRNIPTLVRVGMTMMLTFAILSFTDASAPEIQSPLSFFVLLLKEFLIGYLIGFIVTLFGYAITFGGEVMDIQMGISMSKVYDPSSNVSLSLMATYYNTMYMLLFFAAGGHITLLHIFLLSGNIVPFGQVAFRSEVWSAILDLFSECTILAAKFMMPIIGIELLVEIGMGLIMKAVPQINVFVLNVQIKLAVGILLLTLMYVPFSNFIENIITLLFDAIDGIIRMLQ